jgi:lipoprotein signal peptidase
VTDFIRNGPNAFNIADIAIFAGGVIVLATLIASYIRTRMRPDATASSER